MAVLEPSLQSLFAPTSRTGFMSRYWGVQPLHARHDPAHLEGLARDLGDTSFAALSESHRDPVRHAAERDRPVDWSRIEPVEIFRVASTIGGTFYFLDMARQRPGIERWIRDLARDLDVGPMVHGARASLYVSTAGFGVAPHFDKNENIIIQLRGRKRWSLAKQELELPTANYLEDPLGELPLCSPYHRTPRPPKEGWTSFDMCPGDVMYVPRGCWHATECTTDESASLSITFVPTTWADFVLPAVRRMLIRDPRWRRHVSGWSAEEGPSVVEQCEALLEHLPRELAALRPEELFAAEMQYPDLDWREDQLRRNVLTSVDIPASTHDPRPIEVFTPCSAGVVRRQIDVPAALVPALLWILERRQPFFVRDIPCELVPQGDGVELVRTLLDAGVLGR